MKIDIIVPAAGESVTEADIAAWSKQSGDFVEVDDVILELETDKASLELTAEASGKLTILVEEGETVEVGQAIGFIETEAINENSSPEKMENSTPQQVENFDQKFDIIVPAAGESVTEADIAAWSKQNGDFVEVDDVILELETDKASLELTAEASGKLTILVEEGETVEVGQVIGFIEANAGATVKKEEEIPVAEESTVIPDSYAKGVASPAAAKLMAEKDISLSEGTGKDGRITKADILDAAQNKRAKAPKKEEPKVEVSAPVIPVSEEGRTIRHEKMSRIRKTISSRLIEAQQNAALLTTFNEVDLTEVKKIRAKYKEAFKDKHNVNLGFMSFFTKAAAMALMEYPILNAQVGDNEIIYHDFADIGIAVSTPRGLVVPVVKNAHKMSFAQIESKIMELAVKGRDGKLTPDEMTGGTFSITNGGVFGSMLSTPIVNRPQSAILGMHNIVDRPMAVNGEVKIRPIMYLAVTYDHRIIDGADSVKFLVKIKELLEDPTRLLLEL
jgi:2-oxoglutarate dehydrogenase E2 component (dihydrolipoamide succinyltransferase)